MTEDDAEANEQEARSEQRLGADAVAQGVWRDLRGGGFIFSSRRLWLLSMALYQKGHPRLAGLLKNVNSMMYHNSLPVEAQVSPDIALGHHGFGTVLHPKVVIGRNVKIFQNVTMAVRPTAGPHEIVIEDGVVIGANSVIMTPRHRGIRIGRERGLEPARS